MGSLKSILVERRGGVAGGKLVAVSVYGRMFAPVFLTMRMRIAQVWFSEMRYEKKKGRECKGRKAGSCVYWGEGVGKNGGLARGTV